MNMSLEIWIAGTRDEVVEVAQKGLASAIVTNPTVVAQWTSDGSSLEDAARDVLKRTDLPLYIQLRSSERSDLIAEGEYLREISDRICLKLPSTVAGLETTQTFSSRGWETLVTTVCSLEQAYLAAVAGASSICPYMSRLDDASQDAAGLLAEIAGMYEAHDVATRIFPASVRRRDQIGSALRAGAHGVIIFKDLYQSMCDHSVTESSLHDFEQKDWSRIPYHFNKG